MLLPILYFGSKTLFGYNRDLKDTKLGIVWVPIEEQSEEYKVRIKRQHFVDVFGLIAFELVSISGLFIYLLRSSNETRKSYHLLSPPL